MMGDQSGYGEMPVIPCRAGATHRKIAPPRGRLGHAEAGADVRLPRRPVRQLPKTTGGYTTYLAVREPR